MVYISGEEMTRHCMKLILEKWIDPHLDTALWEHYDLSCISRDKTNDKVLHNAVASGKRIGAIFKEPTITPTDIQKEKLGLSKSYGSPNGAMRKGWNGITISRDTIHIKGLELGFKKQVLFERHAVGGEYGAGYGNVGKGTVTTVFTPEDHGPAKIIDHRRLTESENNAVVTYHNPLDNVADLAHHFFKRCLEHEVIPYVVTKKTVFKWQEGFWLIMKDVFDKNYKKQFLAKGLVKDDLQHLISDAASMQIIRWTDGGFGMAAHNYDGDMLTDEIAQVHRSPGFITSNLIGKREDGTIIKEYEASHGTVADMWEAHLRGEETSMNPLGMVEALIGAIDHSCGLAQYNNQNKVKGFTRKLRNIMHQAMANGNGTRDLCGPNGFTTEQFVDFVASKLHQDEDSDVESDTEEKQSEALHKTVDVQELQKIFDYIDENADGTINFEEFCAGLKKLKMTRVVAKHYYDFHEKKN